MTPPIGMLRICHTPSITRETDVKLTKARAKTGVENESPQRPNDGDPSILHSSRRPRLTTIDFDEKLDSQAWDKTVGNTSFERLTCLL